MANSSIHQGSVVTFPAFTGERAYMREFTKSAGLPDDLHRWQPTVDAMLDGVEAGTVYIMIDQGVARSNLLHRRGGIHVDGYWVPAFTSHGNPRPHHAPLPPEPPSEPLPYPRHALALGGHHGHRFDQGKDEILILAADVLGCCTYVGDYAGTPKADGDCGHVDVSGLDVVEMLPNRAWIGNALTTLHESIPVVSDCQRTVVRLNVPRS